MPADLAAGSVPASPAKLPPLRVESAPAEPLVQPAAQGGTMSETAAKYQDDAAIPGVPADAVGAEETAGLVESGSPKSPEGSHDLFKAMDEQKNKVYSNPLLAALCNIWNLSLHPYGKFHSYWDVMILLLVFFSAVWEPLKAGFLGGGMSAWEWCIDITFYIDIILAFWTGYDCGFEIVTDKRLIAKKYVSGWFIIDAGATIEWDIIVGLLLPATNTSVVRLCKLIKIARLARASRLINRLTSTWTINTAYIEAIKFFVYVLICAHILACFFFMFPGLIGDNVDESVCRCYKLPGDAGYGEGNCADPRVMFGTCVTKGQDTLYNDAEGTSRTSSDETGALTHDNLIVAYPPLPVEACTAINSPTDDTTCGGVPLGTPTTEEDCTGAGVCTYQPADWMYSDGPVMHSEDVKATMLAAACVAANGVWLQPERVDQLQDLIHSKPAVGFDKDKLCVEDGFEESEDPLTGRTISTCEAKCLVAGNVWEPARGGTGPWGGDTESYCGSMPHIFSCSWRLMRGGSDGFVGDLPLPTSQYLQSMYWSMTTMTTIGYGDRFPNTENEVILCMVCEIIGLSFFALLLTQINNLNDVLGKTVQEANDTKNEIVGFMKHSDLPFELIEDVIQYLNFKASSISGFYFDEDDPRFNSLSHELKKDLKVRLFTPALERVKMFGYSKEDEKEKERVGTMFRKTDTDGGGYLDKEEIRGLTKRLHIDFTDEQLSQAMNEMDPEGNNAVDFEEFEAWWFLKRFGVKRAPPAPRRFLEELAAAMTVSACSPSDPILECGEYGSHLIMVLTGTVEVVQRDPLWREGKTEHEVLQRPIKYDDREPVFGLPACLERESDRMVLAQTTQEWFARASKQSPDGFCDIARVPGHVLRGLVAEYWPEGREVWLAIAKNQYHSIWHEDKMESAHRRASIVGVAGGSVSENMAALERRVDHSLEQLRTEVDTTIGAIGSKLDALLAKAG